MSNRRRTLGKSCDNKGSVNQHPLVCSSISPHCVHIPCNYENSGGWGGGGEDNSPCNFLQHLRSGSQSLLCFKRQLFMLDVIFYSSWIDIIQNLISKHWHSAAFWNNCVQRAVQVSFVKLQLLLNNLDLLQIYVNIYIHIYLYIYNIYIQIIWERGRGVWLAYSSRVILMSQKTYKNNMISNHLSSRKGTEKKQHLIHLRSVTCSNQCTKQNGETFHNIQRQEKGKDPHLI